MQRTMTQGTARATGVFAIALGLVVHAFHQGATSLNAT
jgi:hypothetical protein